MSITKRSAGMTAAVLLICAAMLLSFAFVAFFAEHECSHDHCPLCRMIDMCVQTARLIAPLFAAVPGIAAIAAVTAFVSAFAGIMPISSDPVKMKVRLRN